jgi:acetyltransferase
LKYARSLVEKGCRIAAVKAGTTDAGSRAVSSHTGALTGSDSATDALLRKAGIVRCYSREELVYVAGVMQHKELEGKNLAVITHAGGPGVLLTDELTRGGLNVPHIKGKAADELKSKLFPGSSVANPIDFLATGTSEQLGIILDYVDDKFENIDGSFVIFGTTGMWDVGGVYDVLHEKMNTCHKPIFPVLPSVVQAGDAVQHFESLGRIAFADEVVLGKALCKVHNTHKPFAKGKSIDINIDAIRKIIEGSDDGYLMPDNVRGLLNAAGISHTREYVVASISEVESIAEKTGFPLVMKVVGPVHKSDVGGVQLNIYNIEDVKKVFAELMAIDEASGVLMQEMLGGTEVYAGAKREESSHLVLCGLGGIFVEVLKDVSAAITPVGYEEAEYMLGNIKAYDIIKGVRGSEGVNISMFIDVIVRLSALVEAAPEIAEMDINPLMGTQKYIKAVDARILIKKIEK